MCETAHLYSKAAAKMHLAFALASECSDLYSVNTFFPLIIEK